MQKFTFAFVPAPVFPFCRIVTVKLHNSFLVESFKTLFLTFSCLFFHNMLCKTQVLTPKDANVIIKLHSWQKYPASTQMPGIAANCKVSLKYKREVTQHVI